MQTIDLPLDQDGRLQRIAQPRLPKFGIYVIRVGEEVVRVGETSTGVKRIVKGLREPLRRVLRGKERKNYLAYSWRTEFANTKIHADFFALPDAPFVDNRLRRALEAEVTFQFRVLNRSWPRCMSEIHFLERFRSHAEVVAVATTLLGHYGHRYNSAV